MTDSVEVYGVVASPPPLSPLSWAPSSTAPPPPPPTPIPQYYVGGSLSVQIPSERNPIAGISAWEHRGLTRESDVAMVRRSDRPTCYERIMLTPNVSMVLCLIGPTCQ